jgi:hypothetical protein
MTRVALEPSFANVVKRALIQHDASEDAKTITEIIDQIDARDFIQDDNHFRQRAVKCYRVFNFSTMHFGALTRYTESMPDLAALDIYVIVIVRFINDTWLVKFQNAKQIDVSIEIPR